MDDPVGAEIEELLDRYFGSGAASVIFRWSHLSDVVGLRLHSGMEVVVKVRRWADRLDATTRIHAAAFERGLPCPAQLVRLEHLGDEPSWPTDLSPVPWLDWGAEQLWPPPDDVAVDLNLVSPGDWIDEIGHQAAQVLVAADLPPVIGHGDFESSNVLYGDGGQLAMLHDWDSIVNLPEPCVVGAASLVFPANDEPYCSTIAETRRYLEEYQEHRRVAFDDQELRCAWAAGTWQLAFNAKKEVARRGATPLGDQLRVQADGRHHEMLG